MSHNHGAMTGMTVMESTTMAHNHNHNHSHTGGSTAMPHDHDHAGQSDDHSGHDMSSMHGMMMYFHTGVSEYVLFEDCKTESEGALIGACFVIFFVAVFYEGLKFLREVLLQRAILENRPAVYMETKLPAGSSQEQMVMQMQNTSLSSRMLSCNHVIQTFLHILQVFISYCLMLVFMTYNVWLCLAVVLGAGAGYFFFGWKRAVVVDSNEHCH